MEDPELLGEVEVRPIASYQAVKDYVCPGCNRLLPARTAHVVVVPVEAVDLRRHWHNGCWQRRAKSVSR